MPISGRITGYHKNLPGCRKNIRHQPCRYSPALISILSDKTETLRLLDIRVECNDRDLRVRQFINRRFQLLIIHRNDRNSVAALLL